MQLKKNTVLPVLIHPECLGVAGDFTPYGTALEFMLIPIPGSDFQYYIKSINPPNLYIEDYSQNTISFIGNIPAPTGSNSAIFKLQMDEDNEYYRIVLDVSSADQFVTLTHETEGVSADLKVQVKSGGKGKTQKWKFVKGGTDDDNK